MVSSMVTSRCLYLSGVRACWNNPVPPSGFVLLALILAQVRDHKISHNVTAIMSVSFLCHLIDWKWHLSSVGKEVQWFGQSSDIQYVQVSTFNSVQSLTLLVLPRLGSYMNPCYHCTHCNATLDVT